MRNTSGFSDRAPGLKEDPSKSDTASARMTGLFFSSFSSTWRFPYLMFEGAVRGGLDRGSLLPKEE